MPGSLPGELLNGVGDLCKLPLAVSSADSVDQDTIARKHIERRDRLAAIKL